MARRIAVAFCIFALLALFVFPRRQLNIFCDAVEELSEDTVAAILDEDWERCSNNLAQINDLYEINKTFLHLFLSHECVEVLETAIRGSIQLIKVEDQPQSLLEMETIITHVRYLKTIEALKLLTVL